MSRTRTNVREEPARAAVRTEEPERTRQRRGNQVIDPFHIDADTLADLAQRGISIEFKRHEVFGQVDFAYQRSLQEQGWLPADHSMLPGLFAPVGTKGAVIVEGMMLMERPISLTEEAKREELRSARQAVRIGEKRITEAPDGHAERTGARIGSSVERIAVPD